MAPESVYPLTLTYRERHTFRLASECSRGEDCTSGEIRKMLSSHCRPVNVYWFQWEDVTFMVPERTAMNIKLVWNVLKQINNNLSARCKAKLRDLCKQVP